MGCLLLSLDFFFSASRFPPLNFLSRVSSHQFVSVSSITVLPLSILFLSLSQIPQSSLVASSTHLSSSSISGLSPLSSLILSFRPNLLARHCHLHLDLFPAFSGFFLDPSSEYSSSPSTHPIAFFEPIGAALYPFLQSKNTLRRPRTIYTRLRT